MFGLRLHARSRPRDEAEKPFWISYADLMTALMVLFLVVMAVALLAVTKTVSERERQEAEQRQDIQKLLDRFEEVAQQERFKGITIDRNRNVVDFGTRAQFPFAKSTLTSDQQRLLRAFVPAILEKANDDLGKRVLKEIVVDGFTDKTGFVPLKPRPESAAQPTCPVCLVRQGRSGGTGHDTGATGARSRTVRRGGLLLQRGEGDGRRKPAGRNAAAVPRGAREAKASRGRCAWELRQLRAAWLMDALSKLKSLLAPASQAHLARPWAVERTIDSHIAHLERHLKDGAGAYVPKDLQEEAVRRFWSSKRVDNLKDARLVSFGVALPVGPQRLRVIEDKDRFPALLEGVDQYLPAPKQYRRCYQGLMSGYFAYDPEVNEAPKVGRENWATLREYLGKRASRVREGERNPQWTDSLQQHKTLFGENPCTRYGAALLAGAPQEVDELREILNISDSSWFMRKLYLAQVQAAVGKPQSEFLDLLYRVLDLLQENELIRDEGLALVLDRFAKLRPPPLAVPLRDAAVNWWGNPWLQSNAMRWGRVSPEARAMVSEWLKLEFIEAFFTLLAEEHTGDNRRLEFWARYVSVIEDIHFALGADARDNSSPDFKALRKKMAGLVVPLQDNVRSNNAFIMRIGPLVIVEFSGYSNACYGYTSNKSLPFRFDMPLVLPKDVKNSLKHSNRELWLSHQDGIRGYETWEERFEAELADGFGVKPKKSTIKRVVMNRPPSPPPPPTAPQATQRVPTAAGRAPSGLPTAGNLTCRRNRAAQQHRSVVGHRQLQDGELQPQGSGHIRGAVWSKSRRHERGWRQPMGPNRRLAPGHQWCVAEVGV
jgi:hypothetical protein